MKREELLRAVERELTNERYEHTLGVVETAIKLAERFGADVERAEIAAILHDYSKCWSIETLRKWIIERDLDKQLLQHSAALWHAFVGADAVRIRLGIEDEYILDAIRYHTSGRANMTVLEKVVYLADYIEPGRDFPGLQEVRELAEYNLNGAVLRSLNNTIMFLVRTDRKLFPLTIEARNDLIDQI